MYSLQRIKEMADLGLEPGSAATLPKEADDPESESPFFYTRSLLPFKKKIESNNVHSSFKKDNRSRQFGLTTQLS